MTFVSKIEAHPTNTQDAHPLGIVAVATVRGVEGVRVMPRMARTGVADGWVSSQRVENNVIHYSDDVTDVRPLVVLDLSGDPHAVARLREVAERYLKHKYDYAHDLLVSIADQIEAQMKPPRIPEPGLYGVVESFTKRLPCSARWVHMVVGPSDEQWLNDEGEWANWTDLYDPTLIREGINA